MKKTFLCSQGFKQGNEHVWDSRPIMLYLEPDSFLNDGFEFVTSHVL